MTTIITAVVAAGNFETTADAHIYASALAEVAVEAYPGANINVTIMDRQTGGATIRVVTDGDEDEAAAIWLDEKATRRAF